jgi:hypothetical protein
MKTLQIKSSDLEVPLHLYSLVLVTAFIAYLVWAISNVVIAKDDFETRVPMIQYHTNVYDAFLESQKVIEIKETPVVQPIEIEAIQERSVSSVYASAKSFTESYPDSRIDSEYFDLLYASCGDEYIKTVVAMSVSECGMGRDCKTNSNFWGWFKGGNRSYDPSREEMAVTICEGVRNQYPRIHEGIGIARYTGNDRVGNWSRIFNWAYSQM